MACSEIEPAPEPPAAPAVDRESWGARLEVRDGQSTAIITAPYVQDLQEGELARADSGVTIEFVAAGGRRRTVVRARRLTLAYKSHLVGVADSVRLRTGDSLRAAADTLVWDPDADVLTIPGPVRLEQPQGHTVGRSLRTSPGMERWSVREPQTRWRPHGEGVAPPLSAAGRSVEVHSERGRVVALYDSFRGDFDGRALASDAAQYSEAAGGRAWLAGHVTIADSGWHLGADTVVYDLGDRTVEAAGDVGLEDGGLRLAAARLSEAPGGESWVARGEPAVVNDGELSLASRRITFTGSTESLAAAPARLSRGDRLLLADSLVYDRGSEVARAVGSVRLTSDAFAGEVQAARAAYHPGEGLASMTGGPLLRRHDGDRQVVIGADTVELDLERRLLRGASAFAVAAGPVSVRSHRGEFLGGEDLARLAGQVELLQTAGDGAHLRADSMVVHLDGQAIARVDVPAALSGTVGRAATRVTWLTAAGGEVELSEGRLTRLTLAGSAEATHREARHGRASRFSASNMTLRFGADEVLQSVEARGGAHVSAALPGPGSRREVDGEREESAHNRVAGEALDILLEDGAVVEVRVLESIEGRFQPAVGEVRAGEARQETGHVADR